MSSFSIVPPSPDSPTYTESKPFLKVLTHPSAASVSESELGQSPVSTNSEPSSATLEVPTVTIDSPQTSTSRLSPTNRWRSYEPFRQSPTLSRSNSLASEPGGGFEEWECDQAFQFQIPKSTDDPWEAGYKIAHDHDKEMCDAWREGIGQLLIFAGLFSAALVAFLAVSCPMLNADPNSNQNDLLLRIITQLQIQSGANNVTLPPLPPPINAYRPSSQVFVANMCWFISLTVALGTVLFGTVCLQWIREFERNPRLGFKEAFEFRQMRYEGLMDWGIPFIISSLPLLLQLSLLLFFLGLSFFLQNFDPIIAASISVLIALIVVFLCVTMMLPAMQCFTSSSKSHDQRSSLCPFKSPYARLFGVFVSSCSLCLINIYRFFSDNPDAFQEKRAFFQKIFQSGSGWTSVDMAWLQTSYDTSRGAKDSCPHSPAALAWLARTYTPSHDALCAFYHCLRDIDSSAAMATLQKLSSVPSSTNFDWMAVDYGVKDIQSAFALDNFVNASPQLHNSLLSHRVELFVRILNQGLNPKTGRRIGADVRFLFEKKLLAVPLAEHDFVILPDVCKLQLINTFLLYLEIKKELLDFLADIVIKIVYKTMKTKPLTSDQMLREKLSIFNKQLNSSLYGQDIIMRHSVRHSVRELVIKYIDQFGEEGYTGKFSSFRASFKHLKKQIESDIRRKDGNWMEGSP